ncbi:MAG: transglycosylase family protein, partial [Ilumatobacter sp.]
RTSAGAAPSTIDDHALIAEAVAQNRASRIAAPAPPDVSAAPEAEIEQVWLDLAECESNQRWDYNGPSGYDGGLQFLPATWVGVGGRDFAEFAWQATPLEQVTVAKRLLEIQGWGAWPACSRKLGLR